MKSSNEVHSFAKALQKALGQGVKPIRLSRNASISESASILAIIEGLRTACLLSTLTASQSSLVALQATLNNIQSFEVSIVVHKASQQLFIVNNNLFIRRWNDTSRKDCFYAVDKNGKTEQERLQFRMPDYFQALLSALSEQIIALGKEGSHSTAVITLGGDTAPVEGVALAGWLLEYEVVYFFDVGRSDNAAACLWEQEHGWHLGDDGAEVTLSNCLAGVPLVLVVVHLSSSVLYQFTAPCSVIEEVAKKLDINDCSIQGVCKAIKERLQSRARSRSISVTYENVVLDRVAM